MKGKPKNEYVDKKHEYNEHDMKDPEGYEWVDVPNQWK